MWFTSVGAPHPSTTTLLNQIFKSNRSRCPQTRSYCSRWAFMLHGHVAALPCHNAVAKKRSIALNVFIAVRTVRTARIREDIDLVSCDFNGASWRRTMGADQQYYTSEEAFKNARLPELRGPSHLRSLGSIPHGPMCSDSSSLQTHTESLASTAFFEIHHEELGRQAMAAHLLSNANVEEPNREQEASSEVAALRAADHSPSRVHQGHKNCERGCR